MAAPTVAIGRLATRIRAPDAEAAYAAGRLVDAVVRRLGAPLDAALPRALADAGLDETAVLAIPRLTLRLRIEGEVTATELGAAWAEALARAIVAAVPAARAAGPNASDALAEDAAWPALFASTWSAESALLLAAARGEAAPWWAKAAQADLNQAGAAARLLAAWTARDPARAVERMAALLAAAPEVAVLLTAAEAAAIADRLMVALRGAMPAIAPTATVLGSGAWSAALLDLLGRLPDVLRDALAALRPELRLPWIVVAVMAHAPSWAALLPGLLSSLGGLAPEAWRGAARAGPKATSPRASPMEAGLSAPREEKQPPRQSMSEDGMQVTEVLGGGLLLLLRPVAALAPEWLTLGDGLADRMLALGLLALRRLALPLPPPARRAALERDRPLLAVFVGAPPPEGPLDEGAPAADPEVEAMLARLLAATPTGIAPMSGALRRVYGDRDPFAGDLAGDALCRLVLRPGRLRVDAAMAELVWPRDAADLVLRRAGWDQDPGWLPWIGRRVTFRFGDSP